MIEYTFRVLEFDKLLNILSSYASSPLGKSNCLSLKPSNDLDFIDSEQILVSEMKLLLQTEGFSPLEGLTDVGPVLSKCQAEGAALEPEELLAVLRIAQASHDCRRHLLSHESLCPRLRHLTKDMPLFEELRGAIKKAVSATAAIRDSASPQLKRIRRQKTLLRRELQDLLETFKRSKGLAADGDHALISIRDGRYVIPLRTDLKGRVDGIIHDYSRSHATCFFEPMEAIQENNRLAELGHLEKEEELSILRDLTARVRDSEEDLRSAQTLLGRLDGLYARARLSGVMEGTRPLLGEGGDVILRQARNPILLALASGSGPPVASDILLDRGQNVMIISGPNRGGKTVTLKTLGLLCLMAQSGLHIPAAEGSTLPVFKKFMAEIGDDQDIQAGLSTFSAHIGHLKSMIEQADQESLIIIDEPGMGTDPDEGSALAMAVLDTLSRKGAYVAVSTHLNRLKIYGLTREWAKNARMEFDASTNRPTFSLRYGTPGTSYAFEIARDAGIGEETLDQAQGYLDQDEIRLNRLIDKLNALTEQTTDEKRQAERIREQYAAARERVVEVLKRLESDKRALMEEKRAEAEKAIQEAREAFKEVINTFKKRGEPSQAQTKQRFDHLSRQLRDRLSPQEVEQTVQAGGFQVGQRVRHRHLDQIGTILSLDASTGRATVLSGHVRLSARLQNLERIPSGEPTPGDRTGGPLPYSVGGDAPREINLIGYRVADALPVIDKAIDRAVVDGEPSVRIIHGHGTGRLREAIREHLRRSSYVKRVSGADSRSGGEAITVVDLC